MQGGVRRLGTATQWTARNILTPAALPLAACYTRTAASCRPARAPSGNGGGAGDDGALASGLRVHRLSLLHARWRLRCAIPAVERCGQRKLAAPLRRAPLITLCCCVTCGGVAQARCGWAVLRTIQRPVGRPSCSLLASRAPFNILDVASPAALHCGWAAACTSQLRLCAALTLSPSAACRTGALWLGGGVDGAEPFFLPPLSAQQRQAWRAAGPSNATQRRGGGAGGGGRGQPTLGSGTTAEVHAGGEEEEEGAPAAGGEEGRRRRRRQRGEEDVASALSEQALQVNGGDMLQTAMPFSLISLACLWCTTSHEPRAAAVSRLLQPPTDASQPFRPPSQDTIRSCLYAAQHAQRGQHAQQQQQLAAAVQLLESAAAASGAWRTPTSPSLTSGGGGGHAAGGQVTLTPAAAGAAGGAGGAAAALRRRALWPWGAAAAGGGGEEGEALLSPATPADAPQPSMLAGEGLR